MPSWLKTIKLADDPKETYAALVEASAAPLVTPTDVRAAIDAAPDHPIEAVAELGATRTRLTKADLTESLPNVSGLADLTQNSSDSAKNAAAAAASQEINSLTGNVDIELSQPKMLVPSLRALFALLLCAGLGFCVDALYDNTSSSGDDPIALGITAILLVVGILVLVMGYGNVTIKSGRSGS